MLFMLLVQANSTGLLSISVVQATYIQNNDSGTWNMVASADQVGIASFTLAEIDPSNSVVIASGFNDGQFQTVDIVPSGLSSWNKITYQWSNITTTTVPWAEVFDCNGTNLWSFTTTNNAGQIEADISSISNSVSCIRVLTYLMDDAGMRPQVSTVNVMWNSQSQSSLILSAPTAKDAGSCYEYDLDWSVSYTNGQNIVVYIALPQYSDTRITPLVPWYGQFTTYSPTYEPSFEGVNNGGIYTNVATTVNGVAVPAHSVYWNMGTVDEGSTFKFKPKICSVRGTENNTIFHAQAALAVWTSLIAQDAADTVITSTPVWQLNKGNDGNDIQDFDNIDNYMAWVGWKDVWAQTTLLWGAATNKFVTYYYDASNGRYTDTANEDIFNPSLVIDFSHAFNSMNVNCGISNPQTKVTLPSGFIWSGTNNAVLVGTANIQPNKILQGSWKIDFADCTGDNTTYNVDLMYDGDNINPVSYHYPLKVVNTITNSYNIPSMGYELEMDFQWYSNKYGEVNWYHKEESNTYLGKHSAAYDGRYIVRFTGQPYAVANNFIVVRVPDNYEIITAMPNDWWYKAWVYRRSYNINWYPISTKFWLNRWFGNGTVSDGSRNTNKPKSAPMNIAYGKWRFWDWWPQAIDSWFTMNNRYDSNANVAAENARSNYPFPFTGNYQFYYSDSANAITSAPAISTTDPMFDVNQFGTPTSIWSNWSNTPTSWSHWVAVYFKCLDPSDDNGNTSPVINSPGCIHGTQNFEASIMVRAKNQLACNASPIQTQANARWLFYSWSNNILNRPQDLVLQWEIWGLSMWWGWLNGGNGLQNAGTTMLKWNNQTTVFTQIDWPEWQLAPTWVNLTWSTDLEASQTGQLIYTFDNGLAESMSNTQFTVDIPSVLVNGVSKYPSISHIQWASVISQTPSQLILNVWTVWTGLTVPVSFDLAYAPWFTNNSSVIFTWTYTYDGTCESKSGTLSKAILLKTTYSAPNLDANKYASSGVIAISGDVTYAIDVTNNGTKESSGTWLVDQIPTWTQLIEWYTSWTMWLFSNFSWLNSGSFSCPWCKVFFSDGARVTATQLNMTTAMDFYNDVASGDYSKFDLGIQSSPGVWIPNPANYLPSAVKWIAFWLDDTVWWFKIDDHKYIGFKVKNINNTISDTIVNIAAVMSEDLLPAITNQVQTNIDPNSVPRNFDLSMTKYVMTGTGVPTTSMTGAYDDDTFTYQLIVKNTSWDLASNIIIEDILASGLIYNGPMTSTVIANNTTGSAGVASFTTWTRTISWSWLMLDSWDMAILTIPVKVSPVTACQTITNTWSIMWYRWTDVVASNQTGVASMYICPGAYNLALTKSVDKTGNVAYGDLLTYTLTYRMTEWNSKSDIVVEDSLPAGLQFVSASNGGIYSGSIHTVRWTGLSLAGSGSSASLTITWSVTTGYTGLTLVNNAAVCNNTVSMTWCACSSRETTCTDNTWSATTILYNLFIDLSSPTYYTKPGATINYDINYGITGSGRTDVRIVQKLPVWVVFVTATNGALYDALNHQVIWSWLTLITNWTGKQWIVVTVDPTFTWYNLSSNAVIGTPHLVWWVSDLLGNTDCRGETTCADNSDLVPHVIFDLRINKTANTYYTKPGDTITYTINYALSGNARNDIVVHDVLPAEITFVSASNGGIYSSATHIITWSWISLPTDGAGTFIVTGTVVANPINYKFTNTTDICSYSGSAASCITQCNATEVWCINNTGAVSTEVYNLSVSKSVNTYYTKPGDTLTYLINYVLSGNARNDIKLVDILPLWLDFVSATSKYLYNSLTRMITWSNLSLPTNWSGTQTVVASVNTWFTGYTLINNTIVGTTGSQLTWGINCTDETTCNGNTGQAISEIFDLRITKTWDKVFTYIGDNVTYYLDYALSGNARNDIMIHDMLPTGMSFVSASNGGIYTTGTNTIVWSWLSLATNGSGRITVMAYVNPNPVSFIYLNTTDICTNTGWNCMQQCTNEVTCGNNTGQWKVELYDLSVTKKANKYYTRPWAFLTYTLDYLLTGEARNDIKVDDFLPSSVSFVSAANSGSYNSTTHSVTWTNLSAIKNGTWSTSVVVQVLPTFTWYLFTNNVAVCSGTGGTNCVLKCQEEASCTGNTGDYTNEIYNLSVVKNANTYYTRPDHTYTYTLDYVLSGESKTGVQINDILPYGLTLLSATSWYLYSSGTRTLTWSGLNLAKNATWSMTIQVQVDHGYTGHTLTNNVDICTNHHGMSCPIECSDEVTCADNTSRKVTHLYDLTINKSVDTYYTRPGNILTYTLQYHLNGEARNDIQVVDKLPSQVEFVSASSGGTYATWYHEVMWSWLSLPTDGTGYVTVQAKVKQMTWYIFDNLTLIGVPATGASPLSIYSGSTLTGTIPQCTDEIACVNNTGWVRNEIYDLTLTKSVDKSRTYYGEYLTYTLNYRLYWEARRDVMIKDYLEPWIIFVSGSIAPSSYNTATNIITWSWLSLPKDGTWKIILTTLVTTWFAWYTNVVWGLINNVATIWSTFSGSFTIYPEFDLMNNTGQVYSVLRSCAVEPCGWWSTPTTPTPPTPTPPTPPTPTPTPPTPTPTPTPPTPTPPKSPKPKMIQDEVSPVDQPVIWQMPIVFLKTWVESIKKAEKRVVRTTKSIVHSFSATIKKFTISSLYKKKTAKKKIISS
jgi:uncharacterized repeat protein (TIGR01451 family)